MISTLCGTRAPGLIGSVTISWLDDGNHSYLCITVEVPVKNGITDKDVFPVFDNPGTTVDKK